LLRNSTNYEILNCAVSVTT